MKITSFEEFKELARRGTFVPVCKEIVADLPRPRDRQSAAFDFAKRRVLAALDRSLERDQRIHDRDVKADAGASLWW